jgi:translation initiation factor 3 subunit I
MVWEPETGERLGTFDGHNGIVNNLDLDYNTNFLLTASGDQSVRLWDISNGKCVKKFHLPSRVFSAEFSCGDRLFSACTAMFAGNKAAVYVFNNPKSLNNDEVEEDDENENEVKEMGDDTTTTKKYMKLDIKIDNVSDASNFRVNRAVWSPLNEELFALCSDGTIRIVDLQKQRAYHTIQFDANLQTTLADDEECAATISDMVYCPDYCSAIFCSRTKQAKMFDINRWTQTSTAKALRTYTCNRALNTVTLHPRLPMLAMGGGKTAQQAALVKRGGKYEAIFHHTIYEEQIGKIETGCFSPLNAMSFNSDGSIVALGYFEGQVRVFQLDGDFESHFNKYSANKFEQTGLEKKYENGEDDNQALF